jgi:hypothetical protein
MLLCYAMGQSVGTLGSGQWGPGLASAKGDDGWVTVRYYRVGLLVWAKIAEVDGLPQVEALRIEPLAPTSIQGSIAFSFWQPPLLKSVPITTRLLRALPLGAVRDAALSQAPMSVTLGPIDPPSQGPQPVPLTKLEQVSAVYREAVERGQNPSPAIQAALGVKPATATKYVRLARERGLLGWPKRRGLPGHSEAESPGAKRARQDGES